MGCTNVASRCCVVKSRQAYAVAHVKCTLTTVAERLFVPIILCGFRALSERVDSVFAET